MEISKIIYVIRAISLSGILRTIQYGIIRDRKDNRFSTRLSSIKISPPGDITQINQISGGIKVGYEHANLELIFLSQNLIKISWDPGKPPIPYTISKTDWEPQTTELRSNSSGHSLICGELNITIDNNGGLCFRDLEGNILKNDNPPRRYGESWNLSTFLAPEEHIYGLGERAGSLNLRPGNYDSWNTDIGGSYSRGTDPLYIGTPIYLSLSNAGSYLVYFENSFRSTFHIGDDLDASFSGGMLRYYVIVGSLETIFSQLAELVGRPIMPPRWVLGYHQCRWGYRCEADIRDLIKGFDEHDLPISAVHLDIDYMDKYKVFTIDTTRFPAMKQLSDDLKEKGINIVASLNPAVKIDPKYKVYSDGLSKDVFCKLPDGNVLHGVSWSGWSVFPDFTKPEARDWWQAQYQKLFDEGIFGIWHDMNEPASFSAWGDKTLPLTTNHDMEGLGGDHREAHNLYGLLMNQAGYKAIQKYAPNKRPWIFSRAGWAGLQRYAWNWTGDVETSWGALQQTIPTILGLGLSGHAFSGVDIGGFSGTPNMELYLRWFQLSTFLPLFRTHSAVGTKPREPWVFGEPTTNIIRKFLKLRYMLLPFLYTLAWETSQSGIPPVRPLFWLNPKEKNLWDVEDEFLVGNTLLIAPSVNEKEYKRHITFPPGIWYSYWDDQQFIGPSQIEFPISLEAIPIFVKGGTLLPMDDDGSIYFHVYPDINNTTSNHIYFDDGDGYGPWRLDTFQLINKHNAMDILWSNIGDYPFPYPTVKIQVHGKRLVKAVIDGSNCPLQDNAVKTPIFHKLKLSFD
jgi:alpha-glucosidase